MSGAGGVATDPIPTGGCLTGHAPSRRCEALGGDSSGAVFRRGEESFGWQKDGSIDGVSHDNRFGTLWKSQRPPNKVSLGTADGYEGQVTNPEPVLVEGNSVREVGENVCRGGNCDE